MFKEFIEETIKHKESNYFPWAVFIYFVEKGTFDTSFYDHLLKEKTLKELFSLKLENKIMNDEIKNKIKEIKDLIDEIDKRHGDFQFLPKLMFGMIQAGILLNESKEILIQKAKVMKEKGRLQERKAWEFIIKFLKEK